MNKRITAMLLALVMVVGIVVSAVPSYAVSTEDPIEITIEPDKTEAHPGDTITYTVYVGPVKRLQSANFTLVIPEELTYGEGKEVDGLKETLGPGTDKAEYTDSTKTMIISGGGSYNGEGKTALMTFTCTVNNGTEGKTPKITFDGDEDFSDDDYETYETNYNFESSIVTITAIPIPATGITLNKTELTITAGKNETLIATLDPTTSTDTVTWSSDNTAVATVDGNGKVTAVKRGTATITAKANDSVKATCTVTVNCAHTELVKTDAKASTCLAQGNNEYYTCSECGVVLKADKVTQTTADNEILPLADHAYGTLNPKVEPNHKAQTDGKIAYYECAVCHKFFDESKKEKTEAQLVIKGTAHSASAEAEWKTDETNHWKECDAVTGCGAVIDGTKAAHSFVWVIDREATEDATGLKHEACSVCAYKRSENTVIEKLDHAHVGITKHPAVAATCNATGMKEYWTCSSPKCAGKYYSDAACASETTLEALTLAKDAENHVGGTEKKGAVEATCDNAGNENHTYCLGCGEKIGDGAVIPALGHDHSALQHNDTQHWYKCSRCDSTTEPEAHKGGEATCVNKAVCSVCGIAYGERNGENHKHTEVRDAKAATEDAEGYTGDTWCNDCETKLTTGNVIPKLDHAHIGITNHPAVAATCNATGMKENWTCSSPKCAGKYYSDAACASETTLEALTLAKDAKNHVGGTEKKGAVEATCDNAGREDDTYCLGCGEKIGDGAVIPALGHDHSTLQHNDTQHWYKCSRCDSTTEPEAHKGGEATCVSKAVCSVCGIAYGERNGENHKHTEVRDAKAATEEAEGYSGDTWCTDCETKLTTGNVTPKLDHTHAMVKIDAKPATHDAEGYIEYYTCSKCGKVYNDEVGTRELTAAELVIEKIEHSYGTDWKSDKDNHWNECSCGSKINVAAHEPELKNAKEATVGEKGYTGDKICKICGYTVEKGKEIPALAAPAILEGQNGKWTQGSKEGLTFVSDAAIADFVKVLVDGKEIDAKYYTVGESVTAITLKSEYLAALSAGKHTISINSKTGDATAEFEIKAAAKPDTSNPSTGDNMAISLWTALLFMSGVAAAGATVIGKKRGNRA